MDIKRYETKDVVVVKAVAFKTSMIALTKK
jgi:hypothetical protein